MRQQAERQREASTTAPAGRPTPGHRGLLGLQRAAGNRAVTTALQRQQQPAKAKARDWDAVIADLRTRGSGAEVATELAHYSHAELTDLATKLYSTPVDPGQSSSVLAQALQRTDPEAVRIGVLNADYAAAYREQRWPDIIRFLNAYTPEDIEKRIAGWNQYELQEGIHQAQQQLGTGAIHLTEPMLRRLPPPAVGPGTGPQLIGVGADAIRQAVTALAHSAPVTVNGGALGNVTLTPGAYVGTRMLVSATPTGVIYSDGPALFQMYAPDFVRDVWLNGFSEGAQRAAPMVALAKAEFAFIVAFFAPWYGAMALGALEALVTYDEHRAEFGKLKEALPRFMAARTEFKKRYPVLYDKFVSQCMSEIWQHLPEGIELSDIAYLAGRIVGTQGYLGAFEKAVAAGVKVSGKAIAKIVVEYAVLVTVLHAPGIAGRAAKAAAEANAGKVQESLAQAGITVTREEAKQIAKELADGGNPQDVLENLHKSAQDMADAVEAIEKGSKKHGL